MKEESHPRSLVVPAGAVDDPGADDPDVSLATSAPFATVSFLLRVLRRRWGVWAAAAVAGVSTAIVLSLVFPPDHSATTTLLLQHVAQDDPAQAMTTDAQLLSTRTVAQAAVESGDLRLSPRQLVADSRVTILTPHILQLTVTGPTTVEAVRRAAVMADAFLTFRRQEYERQSKVEVDVLQERAADVNASLERVNYAINNFASRPDSGSDSALRQYGDLLGEKSALTNQLGQLQERIKAATTAPASSVVKGRVLDPAIDDERSPLRAMAVNSVSGLIGGLTIGAGLVVLQGLVSDKVLYSEEIARVLHAPLAMTTGRRRGSLRRLRRHLRRRACQPSPDVKVVVRKWSDLLSDTTKTNGRLAVLSVGDDRQAAVFVVCTAAELAREGCDVLVADLSEGSVLADLLAVQPKGTSTVKVPGMASTFGVTFPSRERRSALDDGTEARDTTFSAADAVVILLTQKALTEPPAFPLEACTTATAVVRAGGASAPTLRSTRQMLRRTRLELDHVVVVGADAGDNGGRPAMPAYPGTVSGAVVHPVGLSAAEQK